jgi:type VI secretion system secreted protein VgrG
VVGPKGEEIFTDKFARVKVQFHWDREGQNDQNSSCWLRTLTPWAGKRWGMVQIPRVGQEVIVQFLEGDPDRPIIMGSVFNPDQMPPFTLPENKTVSGWRSHSTPRGRGYNEVSFDDKKGAELLNIQAQRDLHAKVKNHSRIHVGHDASLTVDGDLVEHFNSNHAEVVTKERWLKAERIIIEASEICLKSGTNFIRIGPGGVEIEGKMVELNCGSSPSNTSISGLPCIKP